MATLYQSDFEGEIVGNVPSGWTEILGTWRTASSAALNGARLLAQTDTNDVRYASVPVADVPVSTTVTNVKFLCTVVLDNTSQATATGFAALGVYLRADASFTRGMGIVWVPWNGSNSPGQIVFVKRATSSGTVQSTTNISAGYWGTPLLDNEKIWMRFQVDGNTYSWKAWRDGEAEPASWGWTATDSSYSAGTVVLRAGGFPAAMTAQNILDDITITDVATVAPTTATIAVNDANLVKSPYIWRPNGSTYIESNCAGGEFAIGFSGTQCELSFDVSPLTGASVGASRYPVIRWSIDGGAYTDTQLTSSGSMVLNGALAGGSHQLWCKVYSVDCDSSPSELERWTSPVNVVRLTGIVVDAPGTSAASTHPMAGYTLNALFLGDSNTEGARVFDITDDPLTCNSSFAAWPNIVAKTFAARIGQLGYTSQGYSALGKGGVPILGTSFASYSAGNSRLTGGLLVPPPDYVFMNEGGNDGSTNIQAAVVSAVAAVRAASGSACPIFLMVPFRGAQRANITAAFATYQATYPSDGNTYLIDFGTAAQVGLGGGFEIATATSVDGIHFREALHAQFGAMVAAEVQDLLGGGGGAVLVGGNGSFSLGGGFSLS